MSSNLSVLSLYTGAGGLDLGLEAAGFRSVLAVEANPEARQTLSTNRPDWRQPDSGLVEDLALSDLSGLTGLRRRQLSLLAGGPPCQPFSKSGYWHAGDSMRLDDPRAVTLDAFFDVLGATLPLAFLLENVPGIAFHGKSEGLDLIHARLAAVNLAAGTHYSAKVFHLNAADFGVPQLRRRVFIVGHRNGREFSPPRPTHSDDASSGLPGHMTAWDAIGDIDIPTWGDDLNPTGKWAALLKSIPEGRNYLWHTEGGGGTPLFGARTRYWSFLLKLAKDRPSWTLQAGPGPATGPFHWRSRMLSTQEYCRIQTFPDGYRIVGTRRDVVRQVGNAVPPLLAEVLGRAIARQYFGYPSNVDCKYTVRRRSRPPAAEELEPVPSQYQGLARSHAKHPGVGLGPGARRREDNEGEVDGVIRTAQP